MNTAERRRWAKDMVDNWKDTDMETKAVAHAGRMIARADLEDAQTDKMPIIAEIAEITQDVPICGKIKIRGGKRIKFERPYGDPLCSIIERDYGIYTAWEWQDDPACELETGKLSRLYIGSKGRGPEAQYDASDGTWYKLISNGNFGKKYAFGGTWRVEKCQADETPEIYKKLLEAVKMEEEKEKKITKAKARLEAAELRVKAAHQRVDAMGYERQAMHPAYPGQETSCSRQADIINALADASLARAELIEAEADL